MRGYHSEMHYRSLHSRVQNAYVTELCAAGRAGWKSDATRFEVRTEGLAVLFLQWQATFCEALSSTAFHTNVGTKLDSMCRHNSSDVELLLLTSASGYRYSLLSELWAVLFL